MFDPYYKWLGIPPNEQPPNHYRLLGLQLFERDVEVIEAAANRQMTYVQQRASGGRAAVSQRLLNELSAARVCLLDPKKKAAYDADLKAKTGVPPATEAKTAERLPEKRQAVPAAEPWEAAGPVSHSPAEPGDSEGLLSERLWSEVSSGSHRSTAGIPRRPRRRSNHGNWKYLGIGGGLVAFVLIAVLISQNLSTGPGTKEEATAQDRNSSPRTTRKPADVPKPSTPPQEPATHSHVTPTTLAADDVSSPAKGAVIEAADRVSLWNKNEVWVMDNRATAIEYSFDQEQWTPVANLVKTIAACSGKIDDARIGDLTATVYVRYTDSNGKPSPVYKIPVASVEAHSPPKGLGQPASPPRQIRPIAPVPSTHPATSAAPTTKEKSADSSSGSMGRETLQDRLRGTTWRNTNGVIFRWDARGTLYRNGGQIEYEVVDDVRIRIRYEDNHIDTFVFDKDLQNFEQFSTSRPDKKPLFTGTRLR